MHRVALRLHKQFRLINDPFPADLHPGACLDVVIQYHTSKVTTRMSPCAAST